MAGGDYLAAWGCLALAVAGLTYVASLLPDESADDAFGDWPQVPDELRPARKFAEGGSPCNADGPLTGQVARHDGEGL